MKGYEYISKLFHEYGATHFFYQEISLRNIGRILDQEYGIKGIMGHCEKAVGYMADGYARASRKVGICAAQSIGTANLAAGVADAALANTPLVAITGRKPPFMLDRRAYQELDHTKIFEPYTKFQSNINTVEQMEYVMKQAFREASTGKPGPVHIDFMGLSGNLTELMDIEDDGLLEPKFGHYLPFRSKASDEAVAEAAAAIDAAAAPLLVLGRGANISEAGEEVLALTEKADMPVATTPDGKTTIDEDYKYWVGIVGDYGMQSANNAMAAADLVIFVGTQTSDQTTLDWTCPAPATKVIQIDIDPKEIGRNYHNCIGLCGDAKLILKQLTEAVSDHKHPEWIEKTAGFLADTLAVQEERVSRESDLIRTDRLCSELTKVLPDDAVVVSDTGYSAIWTSTMVRMKASQDYYRAAGSLGWSYPASLGVKCAVGDRPVICFVGDGGLYYNMSEMETAVRNNIPTVTVVNNNSVYSQCYGYICMQYGDRAEEGAAKVTFAPLDISKIAEAYGLYAKRVTKAEEIGPAIQDAITSGRPALVEVITDHLNGAEPTPSVEK